MRQFGIVLALLVPVLGWARTDARADGATLVVNEVDVLTFKSGWGEHSPESRAKIAARAVASSYGFKVLVETASGIGTVSIGSVKIVSLSTDDAKSLGKPLSELTDEVAKKLRSALEKAGFAAKPRQIWISTTGSADVLIEGPLAAKVQATALTPGVVTIDKGASKFKVTASKEGSTIITLRAGKLVEEVVVNVLAPAAEFIGTPTAEVLGRPADKETVARAAARAVRRAMSVYAGADVQIEPVGQELVPAQRMSVPVRVIVRAPWKYPVEREVMVETKNIGPLEGRAEELWYSNDPEVVRAPGRLYWGRLAEGGAARLLYHHQNMSGRPLMLQYRLVNTTDDVARVALTLGDATPHKNPTYAGYMAGQEFFPRWVSGSATVVEIPPHSAQAIVMIGMKPGQTASGLLSVHHLSGPTTLMIGEAEAAPIEELPQSNIANLQPPVSLAEIAINLAGAPRHVYSPAERSIKIDYQVGGRFGYARIGQVPVGRVDDDGALSGNFGIVYKIEATLSNPTDAPTDIEFVYESSAGYGGAYFRINGLVYKTPLLQSKQAFRLYKVKLLPGESKTFFMETIPLSGGSYPVTLTIKPIGVG